MQKHPQTINGLMRHLRNDCNIQIHGSTQKNQLINYGYYHGYKGYRFYKKRNNRIPFNDFEQVVALIEYDNSMKTALYSDLMFIETAIKNIVCNEAVAGLPNGTFDCVYKEKMNDTPADTKLQLNRLTLRNRVYSNLSTRYRSEGHKENQMVRHYYNRGEDAPLWVIFETLYLSDLACFVECLNTATRTNILQELNMLDTSLDTARQLVTHILFTLKPLRNAIAHNGVIFDVRFKDCNVNPALKKWIEKNTCIQNISFYSLTDYIILICCILKHLDTSSERAKTLWQQYNACNIKLLDSVGPEIYNCIFPQNIQNKLLTLQRYLD